MIGYTRGMSSPTDLATTLSVVAPSEYVRFVADWMTHAEDLNQTPALTGTIVVDALVAAAASHVAFTSGAPIPDWTEEPARTSDTLWYPGPNSLFPNALVNSPLSFVVHGVLVDADSLVSV